jgi:hypothetical protein
VKIISRVLVAVISMAEGNDTLELTPGTYTVGIWGEAGESPIFTRGDQLMITSEFEKLKLVAQSMISPV